MQIVRTTVITFDEVAERDRINAAFRSKKRTSVREWLLTILDTFVAGDFDKASEHIRPRPDDTHTNPHEFLNETL
jgi:hypothetical protein